MKKFVVCLMSEVFVAPYCQRTDDLTPAEGYLSLYGSFWATEAAVGSVTDRNMEVCAVCAVAYAMTDKLSD